MHDYHNSKDLLYFLFEKKIKVNPNLIRLSIKNVFTCGILSNASLLARYNVCCTLGESIPLIGSPAKHVKIICLIVFTTLSKSTPSIILYLQVARTIVLKIRSV